MSKRLQVLMEEAEWKEIQAAADGARLTVSEWVRLVLRDARSGTPSGSPAVRESSALEDLLLRPDVLSALRELATRRGVTVARLVSDAVERQYGLDGAERRRAAWEGIAALSLPVGTPAEMKKESVPDPDDLLP